MVEKIISLEKNLLVELQRFLKREQVKCKITQQGVIELIDMVFTYKEEGRYLFPQIYIIDDLALFTQLLSPSKVHKIGEGDKNAKVMTEAIKKCAPLTEDGWAIYVLRSDEKFEYGVFRTGTNILSVSASEIIISKDSPIVPAILIHQTSAKIVEVKGARGNSLITSFSTQSLIISTPSVFYANCIDVILAKVDEKYKDQARTFFKKLFLDILQGGHGTLLTVIDNQLTEFPEILRDGIKLDKKIDIVEAITDIKNVEPLIAYSRIEGYYSLVKGMLLSDGVTIFSNDGSILGYNVFISHVGDSVTPEKFGGSRKRTFNTLKNNLSKSMPAAYMQSQDGGIQFEKI